MEIESSELNNNYTTFNMKNLIYFLIIFLSLLFSIKVNKKIVLKLKRLNYSNLSKEKEIGMRYDNKSLFIEKEKWKKRYEIINETNTDIKNNSIIIDDTDIIFIKNDELNDTTQNKKLKVGVIGLDHHKNVGNNLVKYALYTKLKELGMDPYMVGFLIINNTIDFINKTTKIRCIKNFSEIKENDYDILMVGSDQTWNYWNRRFFNIAYLKFARKWKIPKFVYGASLGMDYWIFPPEYDKSAKIYLKDFKGISLREIGSIDLVREHLGINATFVLDPTLIIDKHYYLDIIKKYESKFNYDRDYILTYKLGKLEDIEIFINITKKNVKYEIFNIDSRDDDYIEKFLTGIYHSKAVITNSYHAVIFSVIFNKPFVAFIQSIRGNERFKTLRDVFGIKGRFYSPGNMPDPYLLLEPLKVNYSSIYYYRNQSISFLKKNLGLS